MAGRVLIISRVPGFRRGGVAHVGEHVWPAGTFSAEQLEQLQAEPNLIVRVEPDDEAIIPESSSDGLDEAGSVDGEEATTKTETAPAEDPASAGPHSEGRPAADGAEADLKAEPEADRAAPAVETDTGIASGADNHSAAETGEVQAAAPEAVAGAVQAEPKKARKTKAAG